MCPNITPSETFKRPKYLQYSIKHLEKTISEKRAIQLIIPDIQGGNLNGTEIPGEKFPKIAV